MLRLIQVTEHCAVAVKPHYSSICKSDVFLLDCGMDSYLLYYLSNKLRSYASSMEWQTQLSCDEGCGQKVIEVVHVELWE